MKTKFILNFATLVMPFSSYSQIKIFPGGSVSIGSVTSPTLNGVTHHFAGGNTAFLANTTSAATSAPIIIGQNAVSSSPGFAFLGDIQTGIAHPASSVLAITIANSEKFRFNSSNQLLSVNTTSSVQTPDFSWNGDVNTGIYHPANDVLGFVAGGFEAFRINASKQILSKQQASSELTPDYSWETDPNTGIIRPGNDQIALVTAGGERLKIYNGQIQKCNSPMSALTPDFTWTSDANTGIFNAAADVIGFSTGGVERMRLKSGGTLSHEPAADNAGSTFSVTLNADWYTPSTITYINRANSANYEVKLNGSTKFYVAGQGWIFSDGNYLGSDKNIKDDIKGIDSAINRIKKINGVTYKLKVEKQNPSVYGSAQEYMGVIAQDVEKVAPQVVKTLPDGTKAVCYEMLIGLLIEGMKEQNAKIMQLESAMNDCCSKNNQRTNTSESKSEFNINQEYNGGSYIKQNVPNPFSKETNIDYFIAERNASSSILIFDMNGKLLKTYKLNASGSGSLNIVANELSPGMYYYSLIVNAKEVGTKKMILTE